MINSFSKKTVSQVKLDSTSSEKLTVKLNEKQEELLAGGAIALPSFLNQANKGRQV